MSTVRALGSTFTLPLFTTRQFSDAVPTILTGTPVVSAYEDDSDTQITAGITLDANHDGVAGLNRLTIVATTANGYEYGKDYSMVITTGTVGGTSTIGEVVAHFTIETATAEAVRLLQEQLYPSATLGASGSHSTTAIDMTGVLDANTKADGIKNEVLAVHDATNDTVELVRCTGSTVTTLIATVEALDDGGVMSFTPALGDHVWRIGQFTAAGLTGAALAGATELATVDTNVDQIETAVITNAAGADISADVAAVKVDTAAILVDTGTTLDAAIAVIDANVDQIEVAVITNAAGADISADVAAVKVDTAATLVDTGTTLPASIAVIDGNVDSILVDTAEIGAAGAGLSAIPWNASWDAEVESEVNDALDTAIAELGVAAPTATPTIRTALILPYMALRNKFVTQTSGTDAIEIYNDAGTLITQKLITDDGSDYTEAEMS